jgi:hypothetical protein
MTLLIVEGKRAKTILFSLDDELKKLSTMYIVSQEENNEDLSLEV